MCGIGGIWQRHGGEQPTERQLQRLMGAIHHRGPEGGAFAHVDGGRLGLAFLRLGFTGGGICNQPMFNEDGARALVFNGEIYDYVEKRVRLLKQGHVFKTQSDSEVLLHFLEQHGDDAFDALNGEFAFASWDERARRLLLVRDRVGVKPLFYTQHRGAFVFASEVKALLALEGFTAELEPRFFNGAGVALAETKLTAWRGIFSVRPGHALEVTANGEREFAWWSPRFGGPAPATREEAAERLRVMMHRAVERRLEGDPPLALSLSSGLDSSVVAGLASRIARQPLTAFSVAFPGRAFDESDAAAEFARSLGIAHQRVEVSLNDFADGFVDAMNTIEVPTNSLSVVSRICMTRAIRDAGFKAVMSGEGSDELFGGYPYFGWEALQRHGSRAQQAAFKRNERNSRGIFWSPLKQHSRLHYASAYEQRAADTKRLSRWLFSREFSKGFDFEMPWRDVRVSGLTPFDASRTTARMMLSAVVIPGLGDRVEMAGSLEGRVPYLDADVIEYAYSLPEHSCIDPVTFVRKQVLRDAFPEFAPQRAPAKTTLMVPRFHELYGTPRGRELLDSLLNPSSLRAAGVFDVTVVRSLFQAWKLFPSAMLDGAVGFIASTQALHSSRRETGLVALDRVEAPSLNGARKTIPRAPEGCALRAPNPHAA